MKKAIILLFLCAHCAAAATITGNVVLTSATGNAAKKSDNAGVVVWLEPVAGAPAPPAAAKTAIIDQRNQTFLPHVLAVQVGTAVDFPNSDPIFHNAFSNYEGQVFDLQLYER